MPQPDASPEIPSSSSRLRLRVALVLLLPLILFFSIFAGFFLVPLMVGLMISCVPPFVRPGSSSDEEGGDWLPYIALVLLALVSCYAWHAEMCAQLRGGWQQLTSEYRSRWAVPGSFAVFLLWAWWVARIRRPVVFMAVMAGYAGGVALGLEWLWHYLAMLSRQSPSISPTGGVLLFLIGFPSLLFLWALVPVGFTALCRRFGMRISPRVGMLSGMGFVLAWPLTGLAWLSMPHLGIGVMSVDFVSMATNGILTPMLLISLGLPILAARHDADAAACGSVAGCVEKEPLPEGAKNPGE